MSLESPPTENGHNLGEIISTVLPENANGEEVHGKRNNGNHHEVFAQQNRAPGSQFRNGSITVSHKSPRHNNAKIMSIMLQPPFEENGVASPIDQGQKHFNLDSNSLGTSIDSAMVTATNTFAKNRFLSGDHANANNRDALLLRRQLFAIGKPF